MKKNLHQIGDRSATGLRSTASRITERLRHFAWNIPALSLVVMFLASPSLQAAATGARVVRGQATITQDGVNTLIHAGNNAIINYRTFNIAAGETVRFIQPSARSRVLNRVQGDVPSVIDGRLLANGHVYIVNPAGIHFGHGAQVSVRGLVAAAGQMTDRDFVGGVNRFTGLKGDVANEGRIEASAVHLAGQHVANDGLIQAERGVVSLVSGDDVLLGQSGSRVFVNVTKSVPPSGSAPGVENRGTINAPGGRSILAAGDLYSLAVANSGTIRAHDIRLEGHGGGVVQASGKLDASELSANGRGGSVQILGETAAVIGADIDVSGRTAGGTVLIGGDYQGQGPTRRAQRTLVDDKSTIRADATERGPGGKVVVWSDESTGFYGSISARGGPEGGDGGFAEVSSGGTMRAPGAVNLGAAHGRSGTLLYDPDDLVIVGGRPPLLDEDLKGEIDAIQHGRVEPKQGAGGGEGDLSRSLIYESQLENTDANVVLAANRSISVEGSFEAGDVRIMPNRDLTLRTRNNADDGAGGIDLTQLNDGERSTSLEFRTQGRGQIRIEASTDGGSTGNITLGRLSTEDQNILVTTGNGRVDVLNSIQAGSLTVRAPGGIRFEDNSSSESPLVRTSRDQTYDGPVTLLDSTWLSSSGGDIRFLDFIGSNPDSELSRRSLMLDAPQGQIYLGRDVGTEQNPLGTLSFNSNRNIEDNPRTATIVGGPGDHNIHVTSFNMGQNDKMVVLDGSLNIQAERTARLGDLAATGNITVTSPNVTLLDRAPDGAAGDEGLDFLARSIFINTPNLNFGGHSGNPTAVFLTTATLATVPQRAGIQRLRREGGTPFIATFDHDKALDPTAFASLNPVDPLVSPTIGLGLPELIGAAPEALTVDALETQSGRPGNPDAVRVQDLVGLVLLKQLQNLGVVGREATAEELMLALQGRGLYEQIPTRADLRPEDYVVAVRRVAKPAVWKALTTYRELFFSAPPARGGVDRSAAIQDVLSETYTSYVEKTKKTDGKGFRTFLETASLAGEARPKEALGYLSQARQLMDEIRDLGLTRPEMNRARDYVLTQKLSSAVLDQEVLGEALEKSFTP
ncbi:MAG TPA: filamentous hemagglutinin N-terminal domain-containing protein [Verrucomicrobiae bacterium]|nr:filamentous hemagglutinin N-terminal domain-containing protein [Verrucomicrobiae bacterium]